MTSEPQDGVAPDADVTQGDLAAAGPAQAEPGDQRGLLRNRNFQGLLGGAVFEGFAGQISSFIIPIVAVTTLAATEWQMGLLTASEQVAFLVIGLPVGAWVDRMRKRRVLVIADLIRAATLALVATSLVTGFASFWLLVVAGVVLSSANVFFDVAHQSFVPAVVGRDKISEGNSRLETVNSLSYLTGPGAAGLLLRWFAAPIGLAVTVVGFVTSALLVSRITTMEQLPKPDQRRPLRTEIAEGLGWVIRQPLLRRIVACTSISNLFGTAAAAVITIYMVRVLGLNAAQIGLVASLSAIGALLGATAAARVAAIVGEGRVIVLMAALIAAAGVAAPLAIYGSPMAWLVAGGIATGFGAVVYNVGQVSFRQRICPPELLGRMNASVRFIVWGSIPIGALLGGLWGQRFGVWPTLWIAVIGQALAVLPVLLSPLATMRTLPTEAATTAGDRPTPEAGDSAANGST